MCTWVVEVSATRIALIVLFASIYHSCRYWNTVDLTVLPSPLPYLPLLPPPPSLSKFSELGEQLQQRDPAVRGSVFLRVPDRDRKHPQRGIQPPDRHVRQGGGGEDAPVQRDGDRAVRSSES